MAKYGKRIDNTDKERGYLGELRMPDGRDVMTEMSVGMPNTEDTFRPAITKGIHPADLNYIRETGKVPEDVYATSKRSADKRKAEGKSPFWNAKEDKMKKGGTVRGHGCESKGKTKGRFV
jgi:hypothetical protein